MWIEVTLPKLCPQFFLTLSPSAPGPLESICGKHTMFSGKKRDYKPCSYLISL